jgi:outer membrane protein assembly factor BamB
MNKWKKSLMFFCVCIISCPALIGCQSSISSQSPGETTLSNTPSTPSSTTLPSLTPADGSILMGPKLLWRFLGSPQIGPVVDANGNIYFGSYDWYIYSLAPSGDIRWKFAIPEEEVKILFGLVIGYDGLVYFTTTDAVYALDDAGSLRWRFDTPKINDGRAQGRALVVGPDGTIYQGSAEHGQIKVGLCAISPNGQFKWQFIGDGVEIYLGIGLEGTLFLGTRVGSLYAISPDGELQWELEPDFGDYDGMHGTPMVTEDGTICIQTDGLTTMLVISPDGVIKWKADFIIYHPAAFGADGTIYLGAKRGVVGLFAFSPSGEIKWELDVPVVTAPVVGNDGTIYFGSTDGVYAVNSDGSLKWQSYESAGDLALGKDEALYIGSSGGWLRSISLTEQEALEPPPTPWNDPPVDAAGILGWRFVKASYGVSLQINRSEIDFNHWQLLGPGGKKWGSDQADTQVLDFSLGCVPVAGHYTFFDSVLDDAKERMTLEFTGAKLSVVSVRGAGGYVYLEIENTGDLPTTIDKVRVDMTGRNEYQSWFSTGAPGVTIFPNSTTFFYAHDVDPRHGGPWGEAGTPIGIKLTYSSFETGEEEITLLEEQTTLAPQLHKE